MTKDSAEESGTSAKTVERWVWPSQKDTTIKIELDVQQESITPDSHTSTQFDWGRGGARKDAGRKNDDFNAIFDTEEKLFKELEEFSEIEKFKSLFDTEKRLLDELGELNIRKSDILTELKKILDARDDKEKELKEIKGLIKIEKENFPKEYEEYRK